MTTDDQSAPSTGELRPLSERARQPLTKLVTLAWVPLTASLVSLILSVFAIFIATQQPEVLMVMPDQIRIAQGHDSGSAFVYLQPSFVSTGKNERVEVINDMTLRVTAQDVPATDFQWTEVVRLVGDADSNGLSYVYESDAAPLLVSARTAASPVCLFDAPDGFFFAAGTYSFAFEADRVVAGQPLQSNFTVTITPEQIAFLDEPGTNRFLAFPINGE